MTRMTLFALGATVSIAATAHHSVSVFYDNEPTAQISGTVTRTAWVNPHIRITLESPEPDGSTKTWNIEAGSVNSLERNGIFREGLAVGSEITVIGRPSRLGRPAVYATEIRLRDDEAVALVGSFGEAQVEDLRASLDAEVVAEAATRGIFRVWLRGRAYGDSVNEIVTGHDLPYTASAVAARADYDPLTDDTALECIPQGMPGIMDNPFPIEFTEQGDDIVLRLEEWDTVRTIHMTDGADAGSQPATPLGYATGRWDGDALVVETSRIDWTFFDDVGTPQSTDVKTVERFSLSDDGSRLNYAITVTDPVTFTEAVTFDGYWVWVPGQAIKPYNCAL
jgi:hypothetical protein